MAPYKLLSSIAAAVVLLSACTSENENAPVPEPAGGITITAKAIEMLPEIVMSRADDGPAKSTEERKINRLHLFFFDADGNFLTPNPKLENAVSAYHIVDFGQSSANSINIPENAFSNHPTLAGVQVVAIANPICDRPGCDHSNCSFRVEGINPTGDICHGDKADPSAEKTIRNLDDLLKWYYRPAERKDVTKLPEGGMPMFAYLKIEDDSKEIQLNLRSLMARVDVNVRLDASEKNGSSPTLTITEYVIKNLPDCVPFGGVSEDETSDVSYLTEDKKVQVERNEIGDGQEAELFTYYTYENIKNAEGALSENVKNLPEDMQQRWKPTIADEKASAFAMRGEYVDHQGMKYNAQFTVFLGNNVIDNFEVKRNHCYKNNITISGLDNISTNDGYVTFDGRVNVETFNEMYVSIINERYLDAHWCVIPMDIYFRDGTNSPECTVTIPEDCRAWVHLEHCSSEGMTDEDFVAGWGCQPYFTENMWDTVPNTSATISRSRDRIYFYLDENASIRPRTAKIEIKYKSANEEKVEYIELVQAGLIQFTYSGTTYYMEAYEEYTMHYDPLDPHGTTGWYDPEGIPWAAEGTPQSVKAFSDGVLGFSWNWSPLDVIHSSDGQAICRYFMGIQTYTNYAVDPVQLNKIYPDELATAIGFACSKNKKADSFSKQLTNWFLPSIDQLGALMTNSDIRVNNPSLGQDFYWSANTARNPNRTMSGSVKGNENAFRARATKLNSNNSLVASEISNSTTRYIATTNDNIIASDYVSGSLQGGSPLAGPERDYSNVSYPNGGRTLRTQKLRVRAIRVADGVN